jgi:hypothetical protein
MVGNTTRLSSNLQEKSWWVRTDVVKSIRKARDNVGIRADHE